MSDNENPFAASKLESLPFQFPSGLNWETLIQRIEAQQWCASIVGGNGNGKTTLLRQLIPRIEARGFQPVLFSLPTESSMRDKERLPDKLREVKAPGFIFIDGAEQLSTRHWLSVRAAATHAAGLVVTVHRSSRLPVVMELETSHRLLDILVGELTGGKLPEDEAEAIFHRHRGNLRECLRELHSRWAG